MIIGLGSSRALNPKENDTKAVLSEALDKKVCTKRQNELCKRFYKMFLQAPLASLGSVAQGSGAASLVHQWNLENSFQTSLRSSFVTYQFKLPKVP